MVIIDGKAIAQKIKLDLKAKVARLKVKPGLAVILVGDNPASKVYVASKEKACREIGYYSKKIVLPKETKQEELNRVITELNYDKKIHGILVQLPLPPSLSEQETIAKISPQKDVDGLSPTNMGRLFGAKKYLPELLVPATPKGIMTLIKSTGVLIEGKNAVVLGRSNLVGKPVGLLLLYENATVTICHSKTEDLPKITKQADILVVAIGKPKFVTADMVKKGAVVIDVGINRIKNSLPECEAKSLPECRAKFVGDVDFDSVKEVAGFITPVPGGVGPMTIASLMENTLIAYLNQTQT